MFPDSRTCLKCGLDKPLDEFSKAPRGKYGRKARCKSCDAERFLEGYTHKGPHVGPYKPPPDPASLKTCSKCGETKELAAFGLARRATATRNAVHKAVCKACQSARTMAWFAANPDRMVAAKLRQRDRAYQLAEGEYEKRLADQGNVCAICGCEETTKRKGVVMRLSVDHCHDTGRVRGLLCNRCNRGIGLFSDDPDVLRKAIGYLGGT